jgi:RNA polymerase sigma-70 factor (ECF subfamily)
MATMDEPKADPLLRALAAGQEAAFAALYDRFGARLFRAAVGMLGSREEAEDAVQDVFVALVRARSGLAAVRDLAGYLFAALRRAAADRSARRKAERRAAREAPAAPAAACERASNPRLERALAALPEEQREVLALKFDGGLALPLVSLDSGMSKMWGPRKGEEDDG